MTSITPNSIIEENLRRMIGTQAGDMHSPIDPESIGARSWNHKSAYAKRFYYNSSTGQIIYFGNYKFVPIEITEKYPEGVFTIAIDMKGRERIVYCEDYNGKEITCRNLEESIKEYNGKFSF